MARKRMLDPGIWTNVQVAGLSVLQRLLYIGLISNADDEGRLNGDPTYIKGVVFPHDTITVQAVDDAIRRITKQSLIVRYRVDGKWYIAHPNWKRWQYIQKPQPSLIQAPPGKPTIPVSERYDTNTVSVSSKTTEQNGTEQKGIEKKTTEGVDHFKSLSLLVASGVAVAKCGWFADHYPYSYIKELVDYCKAKATENPAGMIMEALTQKWEIPLSHEM